VVAIGSGKGGVGKSTVTVNVALALAATGARVGLIDADIYGPTVPLLLGITEKPLVQDGKIIPIERHGVKTMSMGYLLPNADDPVVWRGPMLSGVLQQFIRDVAWGELDYLLIDLPPGTGDIPLSLAQQLPLTGVAVVVTPQLVAQQIGLKTLRMFQMVPTPVPVLGIIENMSHFECPACHHETAIFDRGGGREVAVRQGIPFLGEIPLDPIIRDGGDLGKPVVVSDPDSSLAEAFRMTARHLAGQVSIRHFAIEETGSARAAHDQEVPSHRPLDLGSPARPSAPHVHGPGCSHDHPESASDMASSDAPAAAQQEPAGREKRSPFQAIGNFLKRS
jgi:ATP-binding protein involved in chromosome partitioning